MPFDQKAYINEYKKAHYKTISFLAKKAAAEVILQKQKESGCKTFKDFFFYLYREEYGIDLSKIKPKEPVEKISSGDN